MEASSIRASSFSNCSWVSSKSQTTGKKQSGVFLKLSQEDKRCLDSRDIKLVSEFMKGTKREYFYAFLYAGLYYESQISGPTVGEVKTVSDMHERKAEMARQSDAFIALPGGYGTMEETLEMITWSQLGIHDKPITL
ncbi:hypothetical protein GIB67_008750 [Kingdonia uniflora]|uniref:cytokinin riboside 5'-monophosphate phosphoribohydrolase n=1 Tax=Kingdonia uniflora TaxID=39325 RepID=A0A7J7P5H5_9MAGN|nr:hypothetical protein GIB67_008750 [Kingdonia uniflora]